MPETLILPAFVCYSKVMEIKAVIFDMDGVITDSEYYAKKAMQERCRQMSLEFDEDFYNRLIGINYNYAYHLFQQKYGNDDVLIHSLFDGYLAILVNWLKEGRVPFKKGALELIDYLNEHHMPICLATSSNLEKIKATFNSHNREVPFRYIVTGEDVVRSKPDPEIFLKAAMKMGVDIRKCMVIEDSLQGMQAAIAAGAIATMVPDMKQPTDEIRSHATFIKKDLFEVLETLKAYVNP